MIKRRKRKSGLKRLDALKVGLTDSSASESESVMSEFRQSCSKLLSEVNRVVEQLRVGAKPSGNDCNERSMRVINSCSSNGALDSAVNATWKSARDNMEASGSADDPNKPNVIVLDPEVSKSVGDAEKLETPDQQYIKFLKNVQKTDRDNREIDENHENEKKTLPGENFFLGCDLREEKNSKA